MKTEQTLDEAQRYLSYIASALYNVSSSYSMDRADKVILEKYANDLAKYAKGIEQLKNNISIKEQMKRKELEETEEK